MGKHALYISIYNNRLKILTPSLTSVQMSRHLNGLRNRCIIHKICVSFVYKFLSKSILIIVQPDATHSSLFIILQVHSTCFGCQPHPSSGVHKTVTAASGTGAATSLQRGQFGHVEGR